ncbi:rCG51765 [Rattus norvegicus]|uniref:RCG51765 n=1 Tax=Rattus norvegicus TaxID=10116 RepID=A6K345_RAT|nr:rCG51765 [Rattus norvegicus]
MDQLRVLDSPLPIPGLPEEFPSPVHLAIFSTVPGGTSHALHGREGRAWPVAHSRM